MNIFDFFILESLSKPSKYTYSKYEVEQDLFILELKDMKEQREKEEKELINQLKLKYLKVEKPKTISNFYIILLFIVSAVILFYNIYNY